jgi:hypothetical protein
LDGGGGFEIQGLNAIEYIGVEAKFGKIQLLCGKR